MRSDGRVQTVGVAIDRLIAICARQPPPSLAEIIRAKSDLRDAVLAFGCEVRDMSAKPTNSEVHSMMRMEGTLWKSGSHSES
jgi:hypothetical protein